MPDPCPMCSTNDGWPYGTGHCPGCHATWTGLAVCHCTLCHLTFGSSAGFDAHLTSPEEDLRHRTPEELRAKGYMPNAKGYYTNQRRMDRIGSGRVPESPLASGVMP